MDVSVIIVSWNTRDILRDCLQSVYAQTHQIRFEVIVVDNASGDGSADMVRREFPEVVLIANTDNRGFAAANNQGLAVAHGRYCLLLNSDTIALDGALDKTTAFADAHPRAAVIGCRVLNADRTLQHSCFMFPSPLNSFLGMLYLNKLFPRSRFFGREAMTWWDRNDVRQVEVVTGCFMFVRREALAQVGAMDERYFMYGEETDWCFRFRRAGWEVLFAPVGEIIHLGGKSTARCSVEMTVQLRLSILRFVRKNQGLVACALVWLNTIVFFALRIPVWTAIRVLKPGKKQQASTRIRAYLRGMRALLSVGYEVETGRRAAKAQ